LADKGNDVCCVPRFALLCAIAASLDIQKILDEGFWNVYRYSAKRKDGTLWADIFGVQVRRTC